MLPYRWRMEGSASCGGKAFTLVTLFYSQSHFFCSLSQFSALCTISRKENRKLSPKPLSFENLFALCFCYHNRKRRTSEINMYLLYGLWSRGLSWVTRTLMCLGVGFAVDADFVVESLLKACQTWVALCERSKTSLCLVANPLKLSAHPQLELSPSLISFLLSH